MGARFSFTGKLIVKTDPDDKMYFKREGKTKGDKPSNYKSLSMQVGSDKNNRAFVEIFGMESKVIKTMDTDNKKIDIDWDDRFDEKVVKGVANYKKTVVKIGDSDRKEFIASYDAIEYIIDHIDELKDKDVTITGQRSKNLYKNKLSDRFQITGLYPAGDDTPRRLSATMDLFFTKDSFELDDWDEEHKLYINGWTDEYISDVKENRYVPQQLIFDCSKINWDNEKHVAMVNYRLKCLGCELNNNKPVVKIKGKNVYKMGVIATYLNGSEELEFNESMLTPMQKEAVELGINKLEDFKPAGSTFGERVTIYKLRDFNMRKDSEYEDGYVDTEMTIGEFDEKVWIPADDDTFNEVEGAEDNLPFESKDESDEDDLFG